MSGYRLVKITRSAVRVLDDTVYDDSTLDDARAKADLLRIGQDPALFPDGPKFGLLPEEKIPVGKGWASDTLIERHSAARVEGYWRFLDDDPFPLPVAQSAPWPGQRAFLDALGLVQRSAKGIERLHYLGTSSCRLCGCANGTAEFYDARPNAAHGWRWPEGFFHYVADHNVAPSDAFLNYITWRARNLRPR